MHTHFSAGTRTRTVTRSSQACRPATGKSRARPSGPTAETEVERLREELAAVRQQLSDLRAATSTFVRGLM